MISSIVLTGCYNINVSKSKKIKIGDNTLSIETEIPFVRYRFDKYGDAEYNYIRQTKSMINRATHLAEIQLSEDTQAVLLKIAEISKNIAKFIYIDITEEEAINKSISESKIENMSKLDWQIIDRVCLKDKSESLDTVSVKEIIKQVSKRFGLKQDMFAVCSSPLSFNEWACLSAVKAREIMSLYSEVADVALPSANHQCMNCCGCIRYMMIHEDTDQLNEDTIKNITKKSSKQADCKTESVNKVKTQSKKVITPGIFSF